VPPALKIGLAVLSFSVTDGKVQDLEVISGGAKKKIEIPKTRARGQLSPAPINILAPKGAIRSVSPR
jgi:hypothetical protein